MVQVRVTEGILEGEIVNNSYGGTYYSFKGVPYAEPPVGDLRFKAPQPPKQWEGIRSAKEFGSRCFQHDIYAGTGIGGSEDCLYLNVYTPEIKPINPLPVMFWIHGGAYISGSGDDTFYGPQFLVRKGVTIVTINYRLEVLGFLCLNTKEIPGNAGMKDQVQALRWVNKNIANFGGDPNNVTIFGESAGGVSVSYLTISPLSKGLFRRAIAQSGVSTNFWAQADRPRDRALALARKLGCYSEDDQVLYEFFKQQPVESLVLVQAQIYLSEKAINPGVDMIFTVADEKNIGGDERFFYGDMINAVSSNVHDGIEIMTGITSEEGLCTLVSKESLERQLSLAKDYPEFFITRPLQVDLPISRQYDVGKKIRSYYFKGPIENDDWDSLAKYLSMASFVFDAIRWVKICAKTKRNKLYLYRFSCKSERNAISKLMGIETVTGGKPVTCHADDLMYLFDAKILNTAVDITSVEFKLIETVTDLWTNFAKFGNPTPNESLGVKWSPYTLEKQEYLDIGNELTTGRELYDEEIKFWENIYKECGQRLNI